MFKRKALCQPSTCVVSHIIPDEELTVSYSPSSEAQSILSDLSKQIELADIDYYSLRFKGSTNYGQGQWLDMSKSVSKQMKLDKQASEPLALELRFKFYPADQAQLNNEATRYYLYLQLRLDLAEGKLYCESQETLAYLIACVLQSELGDYVVDSEATTGNYVSEFKFYPSQTEDVELAAIELHKSEDFQGLSPSESETNFLKKACQLDTYGVDPLPVKERLTKNHNMIGVNHRGVSTFQNYKKTYEFNWDDIERVSFDNKLVLIYCSRIEKPSESGHKAYKSKPLFSFKCNSKESAFNFWKLTIEHRYFFTLDGTPEKPLVANTGGFLKKNHKLKCSGRVERDLLRQNEDAPRIGVRRTRSLLLKTEEGRTRWRGFQQGNNLQSSLSNVLSTNHYTDNNHNKTMPASLEQLHEESDDNNFESIDHHSSLYNSYTQAHNDNVYKQQLESAQSNAQPLKPFSRRSVVTGNSASLSAAANNVINQSLRKNAIKKRANIYMSLMSLALVCLTLTVLGLIGLALFVDPEVLEDFASSYNLDSLYIGIIVPTREFLSGMNQPFSTT